MEVRCESSDTDRYTAAVSVPALRAGMNRAEVGMFPNATCEVRLFNSGTATNFSLRTTGHIQFLGTE